MLDDKKIIGKLSSGNISGNIQNNSLLGRVFNKILGLDFIWDGTRLGVKKEGTEEYSYSDDLRGPKGDTGATGQPGNDGVTPVKGVDYFTESDIAEIQTPITDQYDSTHSYVIGDYCIYENTLYRCTGATTGAWDSSKWSATSIASELSSRLEFEIVDSW